MLVGIRTILSLLVAAAPTVATMAGFDTSPDFNGDALNIIGAVITIGGAAAGIYFRIISKGPTWFTKSSPR